MNNYIQTNGSLDCCSKSEIELNESKGIICPACNNVGYIMPRRSQKTSEANKE